MLVGLLAFAGCGKEKLSMGLGVYTPALTATDASDEANGEGEADACGVAVLVDKNGKVVNVITDVVQQKFGFDTTGKATTDTTSLLKTKLELGDGYNMAKFGTDRNGDGAVLEWYDQSAAFNTFCVGHTVAEVAGFAQADGYGIADLQTAKCTMSVSELVKAVQNAMK